ncbi:MAG: 3-isopropylmalate dehydratase large subunit [bacterium]
MGATVTEKILAAHCGGKSVEPGGFINASVDLMMANDVTAPQAIREFLRTGAARVRDPGKIVLISDHFTPNRNVASAQQVKLVREFAAGQGIEHFYDVGRTGVCHVIVPEEGYVSPGDLVIGADSHTCTYGALGAFATGVGGTDMAAAWATGEIWLRVPETIRVVYHGEPGEWVGGKDIILETIARMGVDGARYRALEFTGDAVARLSIYDRFTIANMAIEAGAKNGVFEADEKTLEYLRGRTGRKPVIFASDPDAAFADTVEIEVAALTPRVACPSLPENVKPVDELEDVRLDQVFIGSCTNGWLSDLRAAARVLKGKRVHAGVRLIVIPPSPAIYLRALKEGLIETFIEAGGAVGSPTCGPCLGGHMGVLAEGETALATTNRNFVGRMGHPGSFVYLSGPAVAAASAVTGRITHPGRVCGR